MKKKTSLLLNVYPWWNSAKSATPCMLQSSLHLARNLAQFPFPNHAKPSDRHACLTLIKKNLKETHFKMHFFDVPKLQPQEKALLTETKLLSQTTQPSTGLWIAEKSPLCITANDEHHLCVHLFSKKLNFISAWKTLNAIDTQLETFLDFAFTETLGYLMPKVTQVGIGLQASAILHLPVLSNHNQLKPLISTLPQLNVQITGAFGELDKAPGSFFKLTTQKNLNISELDLLKQFKHVLSVIVEKELNAREQLFKAQPNQVFDKISRAYGILTHHHSISYDETLHLLSFMRLACEWNLLPKAFLPKLDTLIFECSPAYLSLCHSTSPVENLDRARSHFLQKTLQDLPQPILNHNA